MSQAVGWLADREVPRPLRGPLYRGYARLFGANVDEAQLPPADYPSLGAFFVRRLKEGARTIDRDPAHVVSPVDGFVQSLGIVERGAVLQAKGVDYPVRELLGGVGEDLELEGGLQWTLYLSPRDYHRIHAPETGRLVEVRPHPGERFPVNAPSLARRRVLSVNERVCLRLETARGPLLMVFVGALNVGRIRVVGVPPEHSGRLEPPRELERGDELGRFEMGSTVVLVAPRGALRARPDLGEGDHVLLGQPLADHAGGAG